VVRQRDGDAVEQDAPRLRVVEADEQIRETGLARARSPRNAQKLAAPEFQIERVDAGTRTVGPARVTIADPVERQDLQRRQDRVGRKTAIAGEFGLQLA